MHVPVWCVPERASSITHVSPMHAWLCVQNTRCACLGMHEEEIFTEISRVRGEEYVYIYIYML